MGPENEGKPSTMGGRMVDVRHETLEEIESLLMKTLVQMEEAWSGDLLSKANPLGEEIPESEDAKRDALRAMNTKQDNMKLTMEVALLKLRNLMLPPRLRRSDEEATVSLKRSRPNDSLEVSEIPGMGDAKLDGGADALRVGDLHGHGPAYDILSQTSAGVDMLPLKFIRKGDNTKAAFQKPSTFYTAPGNLGGPLDVSSAPGDLLSHNGQSTINGMKTNLEGSTGPKKRPSRSRRDRNRARDKVAAMPEPVMQTLQPGDQNKIPEDGYLWRKYGNKNIKTASYKRGYYKCRHFKEMRCLATKIVQQTNNDPSTFSVSYKGVHTCPQTGTLGGSSSGVTAAGPDSSSSLAEQVNEVVNGTDSKASEAEKDLEKDELEQADWPTGENSCESDDVFASQETGEEDVESAPTPIVEPTSPLLDFVDMSAMPTLSVSAIASNEIVEANAAWNGNSVIDSDYKVKYEQPETAPANGCQDIGQKDLGSFYDNDQLLILKLINGTSIWEDQLSDISYWCPDMGMSMPEPFPFINPDNDLQI